MTAFELLADWPAPAPAAGIITSDGQTAVHGPAEEIRPWASVTKIVVAYAVLRLAEAGEVALDAPCGPPGATLRHLLSHASGLGPDGRRLAPPGRRRIYSSAAYEVVGDFLSDRTGRSVSEIVTELVLRPLGMHQTRLLGSPGHGMQGSLTDMLRFGAELLHPRLLSPESMLAARSVAFPGLDGVLPGFGRQSPNDWGLGFEIRDDKSPHWTSPQNSPETFGHFGQSGSFLWVDPERGLACAALAGVPFGPWAVEAWPMFSTAVLETFGS